MAVRTWRRRPFAIHMAVAGRAGRGRPATGGAHGHERLVTLDMWAPNGLLDVTRSVAFPTDSRCVGFARSSAEIDISTIGDGGG